MSTDVPASPRLHGRILNPTLFVVGLGYFMDTFDMLLFNVLRGPSLRDFGLEGDALTKAGIWILNIQLIGVLIGGLCWGILGDKIGRKKALLGSVLFYSMGSLGCAFVTNVTVYAMLRFLTGVGLAGELGLGAILVAETMAMQKKDWGMVIYASFSGFAIMCASSMAEYVPWRVCYGIGGGAGLLLLLARMSLLESGLFEALDQRLPRGSLIFLLKNKNLLKRYLCCIFFAMPYYFIVNVLITLSPEFAKAAGAVEPVKASIAFFIYAVTALLACIFGNLVCQYLKKRLVVVAFFMLVSIVLIIRYLTLSHPSAFEFYTLCGIMGLFNFWVLLLFVATEQFGTNMRGTAGTSALATGRSTIIISNLLFLFFRSQGLGITAAAGWVTAIAFSVGLMCLLGLRETYGQDLNFVEKDSSASF